MPHRHLHNHPRHSLLLALTNDRQLGEKTRHLYWDIWQGRTLPPEKKMHTYRLLSVLLSSWIESGDFTSPDTEPNLLFSFPVATVEPVLSFSVWPSSCCWRFAIVMLLQWGGALSKSTLNRSLKDQVPQRAERGEWPSRDRSPTPRSSSMGTRARTKKTVSFSACEHHTVSLSQWELAVLALWSFVSLSPSLSAFFHPC